MKKINDIDCDLFFENKEKLNDIFEFLKDSVYEGDDDIEAETADFLTKCLKTKFDKIPDTSKAKFWSFSPFDQKVTICIANDTEPCGYEKNIDFFKEELKTKFNNENFIEYFVNNKFSEFKNKGLITIKSVEKELSITLYFYEIQFLNTDKNDLVDFFAKALKKVKNQIELSNDLKVNNNKKLLIEYFKNNENCFFYKYLEDQLIINEYFNDAEFGLNEDTQTIAFFDISKSKI